MILVQPRPEFLNSDMADKDEGGRHWFWDLANENRGIYGMVLLGAVFINLFGLASPLFIMNVYDRVIPNNAIETGWALGIGALVVFVFDLSDQLVVFVLGHRDHNGVVGIVDTERDVVYREVFDELSADVVVKKDKSEHGQYRSCRYHP